MYARPTDRVQDQADALDVLRAAPFVHLVTSGSDGLTATSLPMLVDETAGALVGHLARANRHWQELDGRPALVIAVPSDAYVSPAWYPSKAEQDGRVVPTWNYEAVHVHGVARVHDDREWLRSLVERLTDHHEDRRSDGGERWSVDDAPADFIDRQLDAIVGVSVSLDRIDAKQKLSGNRSVADQAGVIAGLTATDAAPARLVDQMTRAVERSDT